MSVSIRIAGESMRPWGHGSMWPRRIVRLFVIGLFAVIHGQMSTCVSQSTGTVRIFCEPGGSSYVLDGQHRMADRELTLMEGPHRFVFWAPERRMLDTTLMVLPNTTRELRVQLRYSQEYIAFRHRADNFTRNTRWLRYGPPVLALGSAAWAGVSIKHAIDARKDLDALADAYTDSSYPAGIRDIKQEKLPAANKELRDARTMAYVSSGVFVASAAAVWYTRRVLKHRALPVFEDKEKARFEGLAWVPMGAGEGVWMAGLTIPLR